MPNHCTNGLIILGPLADVDELVDLMQGEKNPFDFERLLPMPEELGQVDAPNWDEALTVRFRRKYGASDWHEWAIKNWGTKWNAYSFEAFPEGESPLEELARAQGADIPRSVYYEFDTAWSPPTPVIRALVERFPECTFTHDYVDEGECFGGHEVWEGGDGDHPIEQIIVGNRGDVWGVTEWHERQRPEREDEDADQRPTINNQQQRGE